MLSKTQLAKVKGQLIEQIDKSDIKNKEEIKSSIDSMNEQELEQFLKQNKLIRENDKCIFCTIVDKESESVIVGENEEAIAILEINPISKGHSLVIPKTHSKEIPKKALELAQETAEKLKILEPKKIDVIPKNMFGHEILNILPIYSSENLDSERSPANPEALKKIQEQLGKLKVEKKLSKEITKSQDKKALSRKTHWLPKRVP